MVWLAIGLFAGGRVTSRAMWYSDKSRQDAKLYVDALQTAFEAVAQCYDPLCRCILQQDNAPPHTAKSTRAYIAGQQVFEVVPDWPPRSPDLNVIEKL